MAALSATPLPKQARPGVFLQATSNKNSHRLQHRIHTSPSSFVTGAAGMSPLDSALWLHISVLICLQGTKSDMDTNRTVPHVPHPDIEGHHPHSAHIS